LRCDAQAESNSSGIRDMVFMGYYVVDKET
jgi:hypothetical protein